MFKYVPKFFGICGFKILHHCIDHYEDQDLYKSGNIDCINVEIPTINQLMKPTDYQTKLPAVFLLFYSRIALQPISYAVTMLATEMLKVELPRTTRGMVLGRSCCLIESLALLYDIEGGALWLTAPEIRKK